MKNLKSWKTWAFLCVAAFVEWIVVHFLDMAQTATISMWGWILSVITLGSHKYQDLPYSRAVLDPGAHLAGMNFLLLIAFAMLIVDVRYIRQFEVRLQRLPEHWQPGSDEGAKGLRSRRRTLTLLRWNFIAQTACISGLIVAGAFFSVIFVSASDIRAKFENERDMIAPYVSADERIELQSQFARTTTKAEFAQLVKKMDSIAAEHQITIPEH